MASRAGTQEQGGENQGWGQSQVLQLQYQEQTHNIINVVNRALVTHYVSNTVLDYGDLKK